MVVLREVAVLLVAITISEVVVIVSARVSVCVIVEGSAVVVGSTVDDISLKSVLVIVDRSLTWTVVLEFRKVDALTNGVDVAIVVERIVCFIGMDVGSTDVDAF